MATPSVFARTVYGKSSTIMLTAFLKKQWAFCLLLLLTSGVSASDSWLDVSRSMEDPLTLAPYLGVLEDADRALTLADVQSSPVAARFQVDRAAGAGFGFGFTRSAYWLRLNLRNPSDRTVERILELGYARYTHLEFHQMRFPEPPRSITTGILYPFSTRVYPNHAFVFPVTLPPHSEQVIFLRLESVSRLFVPAKLWTPHAFSMQERTDYVLHAWYFGIVTAMAIFNLLLFIGLRDRIYLHYVAFVCCMGFALAAHFGLAKEFLPFDTPFWSVISVPAGFCVAIATFLLFMRLMLNTREMTPRLDPALKVLAGVFICYPFAYALEPRTIAQSMTPVVIGTLLLIMGTGCYGMFKRQRSAYFFVASFSILLVASLLSTLTTLGIANIWLMQVGSALEMLLLAFALADRIHVLRLDRERAQRAASEVQQLMLNKLKRSEAELEERVTLRTSDLQKSNTALMVTLDDLRATQIQLVISEREAMRGKELALEALNEQRQFVAMASHEFRSPLAVIDSAAQVLAVRLPPESRAGPALQKIRRAVARLSAFLKNCLTEDRLYSSELKLHPALIDVPYLIVELKEAVLLNGDGHHIVAEMEPNLPPLEADPELLRILLLNVLDNAIKYSPPGSTITLRFSQEGSTLVMDITDQGRGIPENELPFVLEKYRRGSGTASIPGAGLGLSLVVRIVKLHQGQIDIQSREGVGTSMKIQFPLRTPDGIQSRQEAMPQS
jgi:signal transduction histidine kinase